MTALLAVMVLAGASAPAAAMSRADRDYLTEAARQTWRYFEECRDPGTGLVWDHADETGKALGAYTSPTNIGLAICSSIAACDLGFIDRRGAVRRIEKILESLEKLEKPRGFLFNFYDAKTLRTTNDFVSFVDNGWLSLALMAARQAYPRELKARASRLLDAHDYSVFYDTTRGLMFHGFHEPKRDITYGHYTMFCSEPRAASLVAICSGGAPREHWFRMDRAPKNEGKTLREGPRRTYCGVSVQESAYVYGAREVVPSWGGSMFEFLMPSLFIDEARLAPRSLGENNRRAVDVQIQYAGDLGQSVWGMSPCSQPGGGYGEYGASPIGALGYGAGVVTPHAVFLALEVRPAEALANLRKMESLYTIRGKYGFRDAVDVKTGNVSRVYLALDQGMILVAIANSLTKGAVRNRVMRDPMMKDAAGLLGMEEFYPPKPAVAL